MIRKVYYVVKSELHYYPPCVSQIKMLNDLGVDVTAVYGSCDEFTVNQLKERGVECVELGDIRKVYSGKLDKLNNWHCFRKAFRDYFKSLDMSESCIWFGNAETMLPVKGLIEGKYHYIITFLELLDNRPKRLKLLKNMARQAMAVVTCEETRSFIMQYWFDLPRLPYTMPNKPYDLNLPERAEITTEQGKAIMDALHGRKFVIFQGIFQDAEYLRVVAQVLKEHFPDWSLVLMGIDRGGVADQIRSINENTVVSGYIPAPRHLEITSHAEIGLLYYAPICMNFAFCAPNKIYEYSYFGLPMLANRIPGLENTVGRSGAGRCVDFTCEAVREALEDMITHREAYRARAKEFYAGTDNLEVMKQIVAQCEMKKK